MIHEYLGSRMSLETTDSAGTTIAKSNNRIVNYQFGPYAISIELSASNEFVRVVGVSLEQDFRSFISRIQGQGYHDVSDLYEEDESD